MKLIGNPSASVVQSVGTLNVASYSTLTVVPDGQVTEISFGTNPVTRANLGTALVRGLDPNNVNGTVRAGGSLNFSNGTAGTPTVGIVSYLVGDASATGAGSDFVTLESGKVRLLTTSEYTTLTSGSTSLENVSVDSDTLVDDPNPSNATTVNSLP